MAEKAFKVPSLALVGSTFALDSDGTNIRWNNLPLATKSYVDGAVNNVTVNVAALAGSGLLEVNNVLSIDLASTKLYFDPSTALDVNTYAVGNALAGAHLDINAATNAIDVNVKSLGNALRAGASGLGSNGNALVVNTGQYTYIDAILNTVDVNTNVIATKAYVDGVAQGLDVKESVKYASNQNIALNDLWNGNPNIPASSGLGTLVTGDRILLKHQTNKNENGIWVVSPDSAAMPTRATDADSFDKLNKGSFVFVESGANGGKGYVVTYTDESGALGVAGTENGWSQFSEAGSYITSSSNPLSVVNGVLSLNYGSGLQLDACNIALTVNSAAVAISLAGDGLTSTIGQLNVNPGLYLSVNTNTNALDVNAAAVVASRMGYIASYLSGYDTGAASFFIINGAATAKSVVGTAYTSSVNTYVSIAEVDFNGTSQPHMFSADVVMSDGSKVRTSKISGTIDGATNTANYTEFAIVEQGAASIAGADVRVVWDENVNKWFVQVKADNISNELRGAASVTSLGYFN